MHKAILKNKDWQQDFDKMGFAVIPLVDRQGIERLNELFNEFHPTLPSEGMILGGLSGDVDYKKTASERINAVIRPYLEQVFQDYQVQSSSFLFKVPDKKNEFLPHQDWAIVDEQRYVSLNCWIPLTDITLDNGPLCVLPGSHYRNLQVIRSHSMKYYFDTLRSSVHKYLVPVTVKAGEAIVLNHSLIHYSLPNYSNAVRNTVITAMKTRNAPNIMYFQPENGGELELYEMEDEVAFLYSEYAKDPGKRPEGSLISSAEYTIPSFTAKEVEELFESMLLQSGYCSNEKEIRQLKRRNKVRKVRNMLRV